MNELRLMGDVDSVRRSSSFRLIVALGLVTMAMPLVGQARVAATRSVVVVGSSSAQQSAARVSVTPAAPFPGDEVAVTNTSTGWTTARLWITWGVSPDDPVVSGADTGWGAGKLSLTWTSPEALDCTIPYYAHVQIDDTGPVASAPIGFDCTPAATINLDIPAPLVGEAVTLTGGGEGHPPVQDAAYRWTVISPFGSVTAPTGRITQVQLAPAGDWQLGLDVTYSHWNSVDLGGSPVSYAAHASPMVLHAASAAAALSILPSANPGPNDQITLSALGTRVAQGVAVHYVFLVDGAPAGPGCSGDVTGDAGGGVSIPGCVFPASFVTLGVQHVGELELRDSGGTMLSHASRVFTVRSTEVDFTWSPLTPEKGQTVTFMIGGDITNLANSWDFGGANCEGSIQPDYCAPYCYLGATWDYRDAGTHMVTLHLSDGSTVSHALTVQSSGGCTSSCTYTLSGNHLYPATASTGSVSVTTASGCAWSAQSNASWITNVSPSSGSGPTAVTFTIAANSSANSRSGSLTIAGRTFSVTQAGSDAGGGIVDFIWSPTSPSKGEMVQFTISGDASGLAESWDFGGANCEGSSSPQVCAPYCFLGAGWAYRDAGIHTVTLHLSDGSTVTHTITVQSSGDCGTTSCTYALSATSQAAAAEGDSQQVTVSAGSTCRWTATSNQPWLSVVQPTGTTTGSGLLRWSALANTGPAQRDGTITVAGAGIAKTLTVIQAAATPAPPGALLIPAAAHTAGAQHTAWRTDVEVYNPAASAMTVVSELVPSWSDEGSYPLQAFPVPAHGTLALGDVLEHFTGGDPGQGALIITYTGEVAPLVASRTYTGDPTGATEGTYGQQIPALPETSLARQGDVVYLPGLEQSSAFRTNIGLVNAGAAIARCALRFYPATGDQVYVSTVALPAKRYFQSSLATVLGLDQGSDLAGSLEVEITGGGGVDVWGSIIDQVSGDPCFVQAVDAGAQAEAFLVPAAAFARGRNNTAWQSDLRVYNPSSGAMHINLELLPRSGDTGSYWPLSYVVGSHQTVQLDNLIDLFAPGVETSGAVQITYEGEAAPAIVSRTYTRDPAGQMSGTYGQQIPAEFASDLARVGDVLYLPGVEHDERFRTNIGLANSGSAVATFELSYQAADGGLTTRSTIPLAPWTYVQMALPTAVRLEGTDLKGSVEVKLTSGAGATAWASVVDNASGDPSFIQAVKW